MLYVVPQKIFVDLQIDHSSLGSTLLLEIVLVLPYGHSLIVIHEPSPKSDLASAILNPLPL